MMRRLALYLLVFLGLTGYAYAGFVNGGFESGDLTGWTSGAGYWSGSMSMLVPSNYLPGGAYYDMSANATAVVGPGLDPYTDNQLNTVYAGAHSARVNDSYNNYSVSVLSQTVTKYTDPSIYFAWAAVLQASHGPTDSDNFGLQLTDDTTGATIYSATYNSANTPSGLFVQSSSDWFYTPWQVQQLDVSKLLGDTFTLTLLASDCPYGGHAGYVYLDGFGAAPPPAGVPEPATFVLLGLGLAGLAVVRRRRQN